MEDCSKKQQLELIFPNWIMVKKNKTSFTLIEMLVVIVIIGIVATAVVPRIIGSQDAARNVQRRKDFRDLTSSLEIFYSDVSDYPYRIQELVDKSYLTTLPRDPE